LHEILVVFRQTVTTAGLEQKHDGAGVG